MGEGLPQLEALPAVSPTTLDLGFLFWLRIDMCFLRCWHTQVACRAPKPISQIIFPPRLSSQAWFPNSFPTMLELGSLFCLRTDLCCLNADIWIAIKFLTGWCRALNPWWEHPVGMELRLKFEPWALPTQSWKKKNQNIPQATLHI